MKYKAVKYNDRSEALAALHKMIERKRLWVEQAEKEFEQIEQYREQLAQA